MSHKSALKIKTALTNVAQVVSYRTRPSLRMFGLKMLSPSRLSQQVFTMFATIKGWWRVAVCMMLVLEQVNVVMRHMITFIARTLKFKNI